MKNKIMYAMPEENYIQLLVVGTKFAYNGGTSIDKNGYTSSLESIYITTMSEDFFYEKNNFDGLKIELFAFDEKEEYISTVNRLSEEKYFLSEFIFPIYGEAISIALGGSTIDIDDDNSFPLNRKCKAVIFSVLLNQKDDATELNILLRELF